MSDPRSPANAPDRLIIKGPLTLEQVGRLLGVTRERVRQIEASAMRKLLDGLRSIGVDAPESIMHVLDDQIANMGPVKLKRLPMHKSKPGGATATARRAMIESGIGEPDEPARPRGRTPQLRLHPNGQWYIAKRINGSKRFFYFGRDFAQAEQRMRAELARLMADEQIAAVGLEQMPLFPQNENKINGRASLNDRNEPSIQVMEQVTNEQR